ncbi:hypothetical protein MSHI_37470 [Mycobacterium shinjukuense]|uniref:Uncharacterized protein n=1 Tax=Mycobacterium shinjukuense TaxID=398694 RepID=A0A7I7MUH8_9MYCO|nr:hypothetical protein MSHI_37470 [Mycobacterium shinjukuense]
MATTSEARLDISPRPPANGNINAVATTLASRQHPASFTIVITAGGRSGMGTTVAIRCPVPTPCNPKKIFGETVAAAPAGAGR